MRVVLPSASIYIKGSLLARELYDIHWLPSQIQCAFCAEPPVADRWDSAGGKNHKDIPSESLPLDSSTSLSQDSFRSIEGLQ